LRASPIGGGDAEVGIHLQHFTFGAETIVAGRVTGRDAAIECGHEVGEPFARAGELCFATLGRRDLRVGQPEVGPCTAHDVVGPALGCQRQHRRLAAFESQPPGHGQGLRHARDRLGHPGRAFTAEAEKRVRPLTGPMLLGVRHPRTRPSRPRIHSGREARQRLGFGQHRLGVGRQSPRDERR